MSTTHIPKEKPDHSTAAQVVTARRSSLVESSPTASLS